MPGLLVVRASDGAAFNLYRSDLESITSLEQLRSKFLSPLLSIPPECLIIMNEEGGQLREESVPHLAMLAGEESTSNNNSFSLRNSGNAGTNKPIVRNTSPGSILRHSKDGLPILGEVEKERRLYVYDRDHLDADPDSVADSLAITEDQLLTEPELQPQDPLPSHVALSHHNLEALRALIHSISLQRAALQLAISNLSRVLASNSASFTIYLESTSPNIQAWKSLLEGWKSYMEAINQVPVIDGLLTRANTTTTGGSSLREGAKKYLGDYVSSDKMSKVKEGCARVLTDLESRSDELQEILETVLEGTTALESEFNDTSRELEDLEACEHDANSSHARIEELVHAAQDFSLDSQHRAECFEELLGLDAESRDRIRFLVERKNAMTRYLIVTMQRISVLQSDISIMPVTLVSLDEDSKTKTDNFKHLARLEGLIPAYVATLVEIVRRRSFSDHLQAHSSSVTESLSHLSLTEKARRDEYRVNYSGKLPWEVKGLGNIGNDGLIPKLILEGGVGGRLGVDDLPELGRETLLEMKKTFTDLLTDASTADSPIVKAKVMLEGLLSILDTLELDFKEVALNRSQSKIVRAQSGPIVEDLEKQLRAYEESNETLERELQAERSGREEELAQLNQRNCELSAAMDNDEEVLRETKKVVVDLENEVSRAEVEKKNWEKEKYVWEKERKEMKRALEEEFARKNQVEGELRETKLMVQDLEFERNSSRIASEELNRRIDEAEIRHTTLQSDYSDLERDLAGSQSTSEELRDRLRVAETSLRSLHGVVAEKDRLLRDLRSESELEKAVLEKELSDLHAAHTGKDSDARDASARNSTLEEVAEGLRQQVSRWEKSSTKAIGELELAKKDLEAARNQVRIRDEETSKELAKAEGIARKALKLAGDLRDENNKITTVLNAPLTSSKSGSSSDNPVTEHNATPSLDLLSTSPETPLVTSTTELDYSTGILEDLLVEIETYDRDALTMAVKAKVESLTVITKKWSKEAKLYRERAHRATSAASEKIAFRNFAKGDLVLFLPTRNSAVPVWAGFNVSFPHHFLSATGTISEQMKTREWIVARITTMTERLVDARDPSTNPYLLPSGTRYFLLEVESWTKESSRSRKHSSSGGEKIRGEHRRSSSTGQLPPRNVASASTTLPQQISASLSIDSTVAPSLRRSVSEHLPANATDLARSEFAVIEEETHSGPPSPTTLQQPVPRSNEPFGTPPVPSALALSLARSPQTDPFASGPFATSDPSHSPISPIIKPPSIAPFDQQLDLGVGIDPAFLPSKKSSSIATTSPAPVPAPRYIRPSSRVSSTGGVGSGGGSGHYPTDLGISPGSNHGSHFSRSPSAASASSILSSRPMIPGGFPNSPSTNKDKGFATLEAQAGGSRWNEMTEDLAEKESRRGKIMTIGRSSKGWPITRGGGVVEGDGEGITASWGANSIISRLKGGAPSSSK